MKRLLLLLPLLALLAPSAGVAQHKGEWNAFISVGPSIPIKPDEFWRYWNPGVNIGGGVGFGVSTVLRSLLSVRYPDYKLDSRSLEQALAGRGLAGSVSGGRLSDVTVMGHLKYVPWPGEQYVQPYAIVGVGYMRREIRELTLVADGQQGTLRGRVENAFVASIGVGAEIMVWEHASLFGELGFASANTERETQFLPYHFGIMVKL